MVAKIILYPEVWRMMRYESFKLKDWVQENNPNWKIEQLAMVNNPTNADPVLAVKYEPKSDDELYCESIEYLIRSMKSVVPPKKEFKPWECPDCGRNVKDWKPMFGGLAPEWWATMREHGIDPSTGHLSNCKNKNFKY